MISVIIPVYNAEKTLDKCINSILSQDYKDYEIILVNDGSTDNSLSICNQYVITHDNIHLYTQDNHGPAYSRKIGISYSLGEYLTFVDSDDFLLPDILSKMASYINEYDIICGQYRPFSFKENLILSNSDDILYNFFCSRILNGSYCASLFKRRLFDNIDFCDNSIVGEDIITILQVYLKSSSVLILPCNVYNYSQNLDGISHSGYSVRHKNSLFKYIDTQKKYSHTYPNFSREITAYFLEHEMSVLTAMCRNKVYDRESILVLQHELKEHKKELLLNKYTELYYKISALIILCNYKLFIFIFSLIRKLVGR